MEGPIVVVDDMEIALDLMKTFMNRAGFQNINIYDSPLKALHDIEQGLCPGLIITDYRMPGLNGIQFLDAVSTVFPGVPAIIISGAPDSIPRISENYKILEKGGTDFFKILISLIKNIDNNNSPTEQPTGKTSDKNWIVKKEKSLSRS